MKGKLGGKKIYNCIALLMVVSFFLTACEPATAPATYSKEAPAGPIPAEEIQISAGMYRSVPSTNDRRVWGWQEDEFGVKQFNTTCNSPSGEVVSEVLSEPELLALAPDWTKCVGSRRLISGVEIAPGCWLEVDAKTDTRLWGYSGDEFNTTHTNTIGDVVKKTLTLKEILGINPDWENWSQKCTGDPTSTPAPPTPVPSPTPVPTATPLPRDPPTALVTQVRSDTSFVLEAARLMRQYVGASKADRDVVTVAEPALRFVLDAKAEGLLAALPVKSGVWGENSVASWSRWSASLRSQVEQALGLTEGAFGVWFRRNFAGVDLGSEVVLPKDIKTFGAEFKGVREDKCVFGRWPAEKVFSPGEEMQIAVRRTFDVVLLGCDEERALVQIDMVSASEQLFDQGTLERVLAGPARGHPSTQDIFSERDTVFRTGIPVLLKRGDNLVEEDGRVVAFAEAAGNTARFTVYKTGRAEEVWEVPDENVIRIIIRREVGEGLYSQQYRAVQVSDETDLIYLKPLDPGWYDGGTVYRVP